MKLPGFSAEASLSTRGTSYPMTAVGGALTSEVVPALWGPLGRRCRDYCSQQHIECSRNCGSGLTPWCLRCLNNWSNCNRFCRGVFGAPPPPIS